MRIVTRTVPRLVDKADPNDPFSMSFDVARQLIADRASMLHMSVKNNHRPGKSVGTVQHAYIWNDALYHVCDIDESTPEGQSNARMIGSGDLNNVSLSHIPAAPEEGRPLPINLELTLCCVPGKRKDSGVIAAWTDGNESVIQSVPEADRFNRLRSGGVVAAADESPPETSEQQYYSKLLPICAAASIEPFLPTVYEVPKFNHPDEKQKIMTSLSTPALVGEAGSTTTMTNPGGLEQQQQKTGNDGLVDGKEEREDKEEEEEEEDKKKKKSKSADLEEKLDKFEKYGERPSDALPGDTYETYLITKLAGVEKIYRTDALVNRMLKMYQSTANQVAAASDEALTYTINMTEPLVKKFGAKPNSTVSVPEWYEAVRQRDRVKIEQIHRSMLTAAADEASTTTTTTTTPVAAAAAAAPQSSTVNMDEFRLLQARKEAADREIEAQRLKAQNLAIERGMYETKQKQSDAQKTANEIFKQRVEMQTNRQQPPPSSHLPPPPPPPPPSAAVAAPVAVFPKGSTHQPMDANRMMHNIKHFIESKYRGPEEQAQIEQAIQENRLRTRTFNEFARDNGIRENFSAPQGTNLGMRPPPHKYIAGMVMASDEEIAQTSIGASNSHTLNDIYNPVNQILDKVGACMPSTMLEGKYTTPYALDRSRCSDRVMDHLRTTYDEGRYVGRLNPRSYYETAQSQVAQQMGRSGGWSNRF